MIKTIIFDFAGVIAQSPFSINEELLNFLKTKKEKYDFVIFTSMVLRNEPELFKRMETIFSKIYSAQELHIRKSDPESYKYILNELGKTTEEVLFIDDTETNINAAKEAGLKTHIYKNNEELFTFLNL